MKIKKFIRFAALLATIVAGVFSTAAQENKKDDAERLKRQPEMLINADAEKISAVIISRTELRIFTPVN